MSLPRYPEYKDSGLDWLPTVPSHWDVCALKRVANLKSGDSITSEQITEAGDFPVYGGNGLRGFTSSFTHEGRFALIGRQGALCGNINYSQGRFWASEHAVVAAPIKPSETTWLGELLRAMDLNQYSVSAAQPGLSVDLISNIGVPYPTLSEQTAIAAFLDRETAKIDALIAEQEKLLTLLAEKRQATISHAVTKGLNPDAPMKDSGVEWLGEVPAHWGFKRIKHVKSSAPNAFVDGPFGSNLKSEHFVDDGDIYVIESNFATQNKIDPSQLKTISFEHFQTVSRSEVLAGDIVIAKIGAQFGKASILPSLDKRSLVSGNSLKLSVNHAICSTEWVHVQLINLKNSGEIDLLSNGSAQPALSLGDMNNLPVLVPPLNEQIAITSWLKGETGRLDSLATEATRAITLLKERRTALISAAVTGKIDVREAA